MGNIIPDTVTVADKFVSLPRLCDPLWSCFVA